MRVLVLGAVLLSCRSNSSPSAKPADAAGHAIERAQPALAPPIEPVEQQPGSRKITHCSSFTDCLVQLSRSPRIESSCVGDGCDDSEVWALFQDLISHATREEILGLLKHKNPVVRGYIAWHLILTSSPDIQRVEPLLSDETPVETLNGCIGYETSLAEFIADELCSSKDPRAQAVLAHAVNKTRTLPALMESLREDCLPTKRRADAISIARSLMNEHGRVLEVAIAALAKTGDVDSLPAILKHAADSDRSVRCSVARALAELHPPQAWPVVEKLFNDLEVRGCAAEAYVRYPGFDPRRAQEFVGSANDAERNRMLESLAKAGTTPAIGLLEINLSYLSADERERLGELLLESEPGRELLKRSKVFYWATLQSSVEAQLKRTPNAAEMYLRGRSSIQHAAALTAIASHPDPKLEPLIRELQNDPSAYVRLQAATILKSWHKGNE